MATKVAGHNPASTKRGKSTGAGLSQTADAAGSSGKAQRIRGVLADKRAGRKLASKLLGAKLLGAGAKSRNFAPAGENLQAVLAHRRAAAVERLGKRTARGLSVRLTPQLAAALKDAGVTLAPGKSLTADQYRTVRAAIAGSPTIVSRRSQLLDRCRAETAASEALPTGQPGDPTPDTGADTAAPSGADIETILKQLVASLDDEAASIPSRADASMVQQGLAVTIAQGPADTTALYDFDTLLIAWEDTWTAVFDRMTSEQISELYAQLAKVAPADVSAVADEADDLEGLLEAVGAAVNELGGLAAQEVPPEIAAWLPEAVERWNSLSASQQQYIQFLFRVDTVGPVRPSGWFEKLAVGLTSKFPGEWSAHLPNPLPPDWARSRALALILSAGGESDLARLRGLLEGLRRRIREPYQFDVFVPGSYNFGLLTTYRQTWRPLAYQVGDLVATVPLAPGETRTYTKKTTESLRSSQVLNRSSSRSSSASSDEDLKAESEIVSKAAQAGKFASNAHGEGTLGVFTVGASVDASTDLSSESAQTKRDIRSAVRKAAQDYRDEQKIDLTTSRDFTRDSSETGTISNPNNEITVTYLFYELQRRYEVSERLHRIRPVILVAFEVPAPHQIDDAWLLSNESVLRPALLDASLVPAFELLRDGLPGAELESAVLRKQWDTQLSVVAAIRDNVAVHADFRDAAREAFRQATEAVPDSPGLSTRLFKALYGSEVTEKFEGDIDTKTEVEARREAARLALDWAQADFNQAESRLQAAVTSLRQATESYTEGLRKRLACQTRIDQLRVHLKQNILYYMQAIWRAEPRDQRYMRLYDLMVEWPEPAHNRYAVTRREPRSGPSRHPLDATALPAPLLEFELPPPRLGQAVPLHRIADIDGMLGFRGNYAVLPLKDGNAITDFLAQGFLDTEFGLEDPDPAGETPTAEEAVAIAKCAWADPGVSADDKKAIVQWLTDVLGAPGAASEEIIVPSGQLFIEALAGSHPVLEDFKLRHRAIDMLAAAQALRISKVETIRRLMRLAQGDLGAPDADRRVAVTGASDVSITVDAQD